jgi:hypothetical protein
MKPNQKLITIGRMTLICLICFSAIYAVVSLITYFGA